MLPALVKRCAAWSASPCQQLVSLASFRARGSLEAGVDAARAPRNVRAYSRKRNIFLDPAERDDKLASLQELYGSGRFNDNDDDDEWDAPAPAPAAPAPAAAAAPEDEEDEDEDDPVDASSSKSTLPPARNVRVKTAEFIKSSVAVSQCPPALYPEFAVIGRSNVGKSSLINLLTGRNSLAMVSKTPGKTRCINHFLINNAWYLVDLPGYGYARMSKENVMGWNKFTREYFLERETLVNVFLLIDASIPPMDLDLACANWLGEAEVPYTLVYTKVDKRKKGVPPAEENIAAFEAALGEAWDTLPSAVATSSRSGAGKNEVLTHIARLRSLYNTNKL